MQYFSRARLQQPEHNHRRHCSAYNVCINCQNIGRELNLADFQKIATKPTNLKPHLIYPTIQYTVHFISVVYTPKSTAITCNCLQDLTSDSEGDGQKAQI